MKPPDNWNYWQHILEDPEKVKAFKTRGNKAQKRKIVKAIKYKKFLKKNRV